MLNVLREINERLIVSAYMTATISRRMKLHRTLIAALTGFVALTALCAWSEPAAADFRLCNNTSSRVGIALSK